MVTRALTLSSSPVANSYGFFLLISVGREMHGASPQETHEVHVWSRGRKSGIGDGGLIMSVISSDTRGPSFYRASRNEAGAHLLQARWDTQTPGLWCFFGAVCP